MIGARLLFITWLTKNTFSKRIPFLLLYLLFTIPKNYLLPAKRKVSYMSGKLSMSVLYWIFSNHLHSYCIHCKRRGMQRCHVFLNCCHVEKMTHGWSQGGPERCDPHAYGNRCISGTNNATKINCSSKDVEYVGETFLLSIYSSNKQPFLRTQRKCVKPDMYVLMSTVVVTLPYLHLYCVHSKADHYS